MRAAAVRAHVSVVARPRREIAPLHPPRPASQPFRHCRVVPRGPCGTARARLPRLAASHRRRARRRAADERDRFEDVRQRRVDLHQSAAAACWHAGCWARRRFAREPKALAVVEIRVHRRRVFQEEHRYEVHRALSVRLVPRPVKGVCEGGHRRVQPRELREAAFLDLLAVMVAVAALPRQACARVAVVPRSVADLGGGAVAGGVRARIEIARSEARRPGAGPPVHSDGDIVVLVAARRD